MNAPIIQNNTLKPARLGKGLSAIFADEDPSAPDQSGNPRTLPVAQIYPNAKQPRKIFDKVALDDLTASIKEKGILQPILVRPHPDKSNAYEIVAGERRWRASQLAQLHEVPVIIRDIKDRDALEFALIENMQRDDLTPMEEAETFQRLSDEFGHTHEEIGRALGKSRTYIANTLRLLHLPEAVRQLMRDHKSLSGSHARALLSAKNPLALANEVIEGGLSVRQTENLAKMSHGEELEAGEGGKRVVARAQLAGLGRAARKGSPAAKAESTRNITGNDNADIKALEREVSSWLGLKVALTQKGSDGNGGGKLLIEYQSLDQLEDVLKRLSIPPKE
ncbi:MAG: ParB/RepB/Spo0J family partition protein [Alphaproteobacteria bacterium]|nr:ParB/RepB/Spo0J family partition protein [Alphaproteobacteria bacterium]